MAIWATTTTGVLSSVEVIGPCNGEVDGSLTVCGGRVTVVSGLPVEDNGLGACAVLVCILPAFDVAVLLLGLILPVLVVAALVLFVVIAAAVDCCLIVCVV